MKFCRESLWSEWTVDLQGVPAGVGARTKPGIEGEVVWRGRSV